MGYVELADELLRSMFRIGRVKRHRNISDALRGEEIALNLISVRDEPMLPRNLSQAMGCSSARVAATLNSLEKKGLVTREIDPNDRRQILVRMTDEGQALTEMRRREVREMAARMLTRLGEADARELVRIVARLAGDAQDPEPNLNKEKEEGESRC